MRPVGVAALNAPSRVRGVDLARGLAVLGMLAAHLLVIERFDPTRPGTWVDVVNGRSSILFATLAGVSIALLSAEPGSSGTRPQRGRALSLTRRRLIVRAVLIWLLGVALVATGVPVYVILPAYALLFLLGAALLTLRAQTLWIVAASLAVLMPWVLPVLDAVPVWQAGEPWNLTALVGWHYPFPLWAAFLVAGMAAGRSDLRVAHTDLVLVLAGLSAVVAAAVGASITAHTLSAVPDGGALGGYLQAVLTDAAHSGGLWEVVGSGGERSPSSARACSCAACACRRSSCRSGPSDRCRSPPMWGSSWHGRSGPRWCSATPATSPASVRCSPSGRSFSPPSSAARCGPSSGVAVRSSA